MTTQKSISVYDDQFEDRLNQIVEAFEEARDEMTSVDVSDFLPDKNDAGYPVIGIELLRVDLQYGWETASPTKLQDYQRRFPEILGDSSRLSELAFEEYRMRRVVGHQTNPEEYERRFAVDTTAWPRVGDSTVRMRSASASTVYGHQTDDANETPSLYSKNDLPRAGERFGNFDLICEIGEGAFAKVFIAKQSELADRSVVLKITSTKTAEAQQLARLQHTNIVPIHSVHHVGPLYAVCMPDFGPCTLHDFLNRLQKKNGIPIDGEVFDDAIEDRTQQVAKEISRDGSTSSATIPQTSHDLLTNEFSKLNYIDACVKICRQIAEALKHAHRQGVVHRDLKPANVLLAGHGPVMLLDFNLADEIRDNVAVHKNEARSLVGGTLPYASPEHLRSLISGERIRGTADLFSLGVILYELLTGRLPFQVRPGSEDLAIREMISDRNTAPKSTIDFNSSVPPSLNDMVLRLLAPNPDERYETAEQVCEDLQRHLDHRPLKHVGNRSVVERIKKWGRRHPRLSSSVAVTTACLILLSVLVTTIIVQANTAHKRDVMASVALLENDLPIIRAYTSGLDSDLFVLNRGIELAKSGIDRIANSHGKQFEQLSIDDRTLGKIGLSDVAETYYLMSNAHYWIARKDLSKRDQSIELAEQFNRKALKLSNRSVQHSLEQLMVDIVQLRDGEVSDTFEKTADALQPTDAIALMRRGQFNAAAKILESAREKKPYDLSNWFLIGDCFREAGRHAEAEGCYTTCALMWSDWFWGYHKRGILRMQVNEFADAADDFTKVLTLEPSFTDALINRSVCRTQLKNYKSAIDDLNKAIALNASETRIYFMRAELRRKLGDHQGANQDFQHGLELEPVSEKCYVRRGEALMQQGDFHAALTDFKTAIKINPRSYFAYRNTAYIFGEKLKRPEKAIEILNKMIPWSKTPHEEIVSRGVMYARMDQRDQAIADANHALELKRDAQMVFQAACIFANTSRVNRGDAVNAIKLIGEAIGIEPRTKLIANRDPDLDPIRNDKAFQELMR